MVLSTHWGRDKIDAISQKTFWNAFSWMKMNEFCLGFHWSMFLKNVRINNIPALVQIMAWRRPGDKPLSEPMMVSLLTHICVTRPQWVNKHDNCLKDKITTNRSNRGITRFLDLSYMFLSWFQSQLKLLYSLRLYEWLSNSNTETERSPCWRICQHWQYWKLSVDNFQCSLWQVPQNDFSVSGNEAQ